MGMSVNSYRTFLASSWRRCLGSITPGGWIPGGKEGDTIPPRGEARGDMRGGVTPGSFPASSVSCSTTSSLARAGRARGGCHQEASGGGGGGREDRLSSDRLRLARGH